MLLSFLVTVALAQPIVGPRRAVSPLSSIEAPAANNQLFPVASATGGLFVTAWVDSRVAASYPAIFFSAIDPLTGAPVGPNVLVTPQGGHAPAIAGLAGGRVAIAWDDDLSTFVRLMSGDAGLVERSVSGLSPSLTAIDGGVFLAVADATSIVGRRLLADGTFAGAPIAIGGQTAYAAHSAGVVEGNVLHLASELANGVGYASLDLVTSSVAVQPSVGTARVDRLRLARSGSGIVLMSRVDQGPSTFSIWSGLWSTQNVSPGFLPTDLTTLPDGGVLTMLVDAPYGPTVVGQLVVPPIPGAPIAPTRGSDVALAQTGDRILLATSASSNDVDLYAVTTGLDWTDGGTRQLIARARGQMDQPSAAFDGTRWLVVWEEPRPNDVWAIAGAFVDPQGVPSAPFEIAPEGTTPSVAFAAGRFVVGYVWREALAVSVSSTGTLGPTASFLGEAFHGINALAVDDTVWFLYPTSAATLEIGRYHADGGSSQGPTVTTATEPMAGVQLARLASGGVQAVWLETTADELRTSLLDAQGTPAPAAVIATNVSGARPIVHALGDELIVATFIGGEGLTLLRLSGATVRARRSERLGRTFISTLGLSLAPTPEGLSLALTEEGANTVQLMPLELSAGSVDAGPLTTLDSQPVPIAGTVLVPGRDRLLLGHREYDPASAAMRLWVRTLTFPSDGGTDAGLGDGGPGPDAGSADGGVDAGPVDGGLDAGTPDAGTTDAGTVIDAGSPSETDAGTPDAGEPAQRRELTVACGCGEMTGGASFALLLMLSRLSLPRAGARARRRAR